jgi:hypothetical protein
MSMTINAVANFAHTVAKTVTGTWTITGPEAPAPTYATLTVKNNLSVVEATIVGTVNPTNGTCSATIPANTLTAGVKTALFSCASPYASSTPTGFTVT